jgi:diacylglycerol kinase family enzyme
MDYEVLFCFLKSVDMNKNDKRRILKIETPQALAGRNRQELRRLLGLLIEGGFDICEIDAAAGFDGMLEDDVMLVVGGDGTLSQVVNGLKGEEARLAVLPAGLFNTFCRTYDLPSTADELCAAITGGESGAVPVGAIGDSIFISNASIGYKARVAEHLGRKGGRRRGFFSYLGPLLRAWIDLRNERLCLRFDDGAKEVTYSPLVCVAPDSDGEGPLLRIYIVGNVPKLVFPLLALAVFFAVPLRREISLPGLRCRRERRLEIEGEIAAVNLDGEVGYVGNISIEARMGDMEVIGIDPSALPRHRLLLRYRSKQRGLQNLTVE